MSGTNHTEEHAPLHRTYRDIKPPVWDMSQERAFIENLLSQRFSFFLLFFSLVIAGAINCKVQLHLQLILSLGAFVTSLFACTLRRSQDKLDLILEELGFNRSHPATIIDKRSRQRTRMHSRKRARRRGSRGQLIGY